MCHKRQLQGSCLYEDDSKLHETVAWFDIGQNHGKYIKLQEIR